MKKVLSLLVFTCYALLGFSQSITEFGLTTEGLWFMPSETIPSFRDYQKDGFGAGIGVYASRNIFWRFSADIGLGYRYKQMKQHYDVFTGEGGGYGSGYYYGYPNESTNIEGWDKLPMHSIVVPVHLQLLLTKSFFVRGGIESGWLMNYDSVNEKPELNWTAGFGSQRYKLKWSLNYIKGFKDQGFGNRTPEADGHYKGSHNRSEMFQLSLSYPIWVKQ